MKEKDTEPKKGRGRPKNSRSRSKLLLAQLEIDNAIGLSVKTLVALMTNDKEFLNITEDVSPTLRFNVCKVILDKGIANEKDKEKVTEAPQSSVEEEEDSAPRIFSVAK